MLLRRFGEVMRSKWWLVLLVFVVTTAMTVVFVSRQPSIYEASGTYVVRPRAVESSEVVRAFDTLIRGVEINSTYASIARSDLIRSRAREALGGSVSTAGASVQSEVLTGTNILSISVRGKDPEVVQAFADAVGTETVAYVDELNDIFQLEPLDPPELPSRPVAPNRSLTVAVGVLLGAAAGIGLALAADAMRRSRGARVFNIIDPRTDLYNESFFRLRFQQEMSRAKRGRSGFSLAVLKVGRDDAEGIELATRTARRVADQLRNDLRPEDVLAYLESGTYGVLLPDTRLEEAAHLVERWKEALVSAQADGPGWGVEHLRVSVGTCEYRGEGFVGDAIGEQMAGAL